MPLLFVGLGAAPFDDPGEGMHAEVARELAQARDPLRLTLNGVRYVDKPVLLYALIAAVSAAAGWTEAAARAVSASAGVIGVVATAWAGGRLLGRGSGMVAGLALLSSAGFFAYARYVRPDALFVAALAVGWALTVVGLAERRRAWTVLGLAAFGVAALAKDPLGALLPPVAVGLALALAGSGRPLRGWLPPAGVAVAVVLGLGWWIAVAVATPGFAAYTVVDNHVLNVARVREFPDEDVPLAAGEFLAVALAGSAPWAAAAAVAVWRLARHRAWRDPAETPWVALALWSIGVLGLTALSPFRLPHYGLPAYPAIALLAARAWRDGEGRRLAWTFAGLYAFAAVACGLALAAGGAHFEALVLGATDVATRKAGVVGAVAPLPGWDVFRPLVVTTALVCSAGAVLVPIAARHGRVAAALVATATAVGMLPAVAAGLASVSGHRAVKPLATAIARQAGPADVVAHEGPIENSGALEWYGGRRPALVDARRSVLAFGATAGGAPDVFWDDERLARAWLGPGRVWLVTTRPPGAGVVARLPGGATLAAEAGGRRLYVNR